jgi:hypothetical protein
MGKNILQIYKQNKHSLITVATGKKTINGQYAVRHSYISIATKRFPFYSREYMSWHDKQPQPFGYSLITDLPLGVMMPAVCRLPHFLLLLPDFC